MPAASDSYRAVRALKQRLDTVVRGIAWLVGWLGAALLLVCGLLYMLPNAAWDGRFGLRADQWPMFAMVALILASLLGWGFVNQGQDRVQKKLGRPASIVLFLALPVACLLATLWPERVEAITGARDARHPLWFCVRWYPPLVTVSCAMVFLAWKSRPRRHVYWDRGLGYVLLLTPYALLFAVLELGVHMQWLDASRRETLHALGSAALVLQVVLAFFIGAPD